MSGRKSIRVGRPRYIVFAGINGAGKSTLYRSGMWARRPGDLAAPRVNPDEILVAHGDDPGDIHAQMRAGREAIKLINEYFDQGISFNQETTLSGRSCLRDIKRARELGYHVVMCYVGVESPELANERIAHRVALGGHAIDPQEVVSRYRKSIDHLLEAAPLCDELYLFDNTQRLTVVAAFGHRSVTYPIFPMQCSWVAGFLEHIDRAFRGR